MAGRSHASPQHTWRGRAVRRPSGAGRGARRVLMTLLAVGLIAAMAGLLWWWVFLPSVHVVCLPVVEYDALAVAPIPFSAENTDGLRGTWVRREATVLDGLGTSRGMATLANRLQGIVSRPKDTLILYLSVHGVSYDGTAYVLCSDYPRKGYLAEGETGRYPLTDLLDQVKQCPAAVKLLMLDAGHLDADPRLGMLVNEFPRLLADAVESTDDPALWVITANGSMETSHTSHAWQQSVFAHYLAEGLRGGADRNDDGTVELDELFHFVRSSVVAWVKHQTRGRESQTPMLLAGGQGICDPPEGLTLLPVQDDEPAEETASEDEESPEAGQSSGRQDVRKLLDRAWQWRDRMQTRGKDNRWAPQDYAPHLWREYQRLLLGYELRYRCGAAFDAGALAEDLQANVLPPVGQEDFLHGDALPAQTGRATVLGRLFEARQLFNRSPGHAKLEQEAAGDPLVERASRVFVESVQLRNDLLLDAPHYAAWHAAASRTSSRPHEQYVAITELLEELHEFVLLLESFEDYTFAGASRAVIEKKLDALVDRKTTLQQLRQTIERDGLTTQVELVRETAREKNARGVSRKIEALLCTPLLSAAQRMELLDLLAGQTTTSPELDPEERSDNVPPVIAAWQWDRRREQAGLEVLLLSLADDPLCDVDLPRELASSANPSSEDARWRAYRQLGVGLGRFYEGLPTGVLTVAGTQEPHAGGRFLRLLDARDTRRIDVDVVEIAAGGFPQVADLIAGRATIEGPDTLILDRDGPVTLELAVDAAGGSSRDVRVTLRYDPAKLTVTSTQRELPVLPAAPTEVALDADRRATLRYQVQPKTDVEFAETVIVEVVSGGQRVAHEVSARLAAPDVVELLVEGMPGTFEARDRTAGGGDQTGADLRLRPFPNRTTAYRFALRNLSGEEKTVNVILAAVPKPPPGRRASPEDPLDDFGQLRRNYTPLTEAPVVVQLPADGQPVPIAVPPPEPAPAEETAAPAAPDDTAPKPDDRPVLTHGLVCITSDAADPQRRWISRVDFAPLAPKDYLEPRVGYDLTRRRITVEVKARDADADGAADLFPEVNEKEPVTLFWEPTDSLPPGTTMKETGDLKSADAVGTLFAIVEPDPTGRPVEVRLTVDGYPRAFTYLVRCDRARPRVPREDRTLRRIKITRPEPRDPFRIPLVEPLVVEFQVDAPDDAFRHTDDVVEIGIDEDADRVFRPSERKQFFADRQVDIRLDEIGPGGVMRFDASVGDFHVELDPGGLKNIEVDVMAQLLLATPDSSAGPTAAQDFVPIVLDGQSPEILDVDTPSRFVNQGADLAVTVEVKDLGGIEKLQIGFDHNDDGKFKDPEKPEELFQPSADGKWRVALPTKKAGTHILLVRALDKVGNLPSSRKVEITVEATGTTNGSAAGTGTIEGQLVIAGRRPGTSWIDLKVEIKGVGPPSKVDGRGKFTFTKVPFGAHTITAEGIGGNKYRTGSGAVLLNAANNPAKVEVSMK